MEVEITTSTPGADIYYTMNGNDPTENDILYTDPILVTEDVTIKARAFADGLDPSNVAEETYMIRTLILEKDFEDESLSSGGWMVYDLIDGANSWEIDDFAGITYAMITEHESDPPFPHSWYISPEIDLTEIEETALSFYSQAAFREGEALFVKVSTDYDGDGDPTTANWTTLDPELDDHTGGGFGSWTFSEEIDLGAYNEPVHIAFQYNSDEDNYGRWHLNDIMITGIGDVEIGDEYIQLSATELPSFREVYVDHDSDDIPHGSDVQFYYVEAGG